MITKQTILVGMILMALLVVAGEAQEEWGNLDDELLMTEDMFFTDELVSTASKRMQKLSETPASVFVITYDEIQQHGYRFLSEVLRFIPGMELHVAGGPQYYLQAELRGLDNFILLIDGIRANPATSEDPHFGYAYPLKHVERIEVLMGPSSALYGADAAAGIINIITKSPINSLNMYQISMFGGSQETIGTQVFGQRHINDLAINFAFSAYHQNDDDRDWWDYLNDQYTNELIYPPGVADAYKPEYTNPLTSYSFSSKIQAENNTLGLNVWTRDSKGGLRLDPANFAANEHAGTSNDELLVYVENKFPFSNQISLTTRLSYHYYQNRYNFYYTSDADPASPRYNTSKHYRESGDRIHFVEELSYAPSENTLVLMGLEAQNLGTVPKDYKSEYNEEGIEILGDPISNNEALTYYQIRNGGGFLQLETSHFENRIKLNLGTRVDYFTTFGWTVNPRASIYAKILPRFSARLIYGSAYFTPAPNTMFRTTYVPGSRYQIPNTNLDPQTYDNYEVVLNFQPLSRTTFEARGFITQVENNIVFVNTGDKYISGTDTVNVRQYQNVGSAQYYGTEVLAKFALGQNWDAYATFAYLDGYTKANDAAEKADLVFLSHIKTTFGVSAKFRERYYLDVQGFGLLDRKTNTGNVLYPDGKMDDVFIANFYFRAENIWHQIGANLRIDNLFDTQWADIKTTSRSGSPELPQERFRVTVGLDWAY